MKYLILTLALVSSAYGAESLKSLYAEMRGAEVNLLQARINKTDVIEADIDYKWAVYKFKEYIKDNKIEVEDIKKLGEFFDAEVNEIKSTLYNKVG